MQFHQWQVDKPDLGVIPSMDCRVFHVCTRIFMCLLVRMCKDIVFGWQPSPLVSYQCFWDLITCSQEYCYKTGQEMLCLVRGLWKDIDLLRVFWVGCHSGRFFLGGWGRGRENSRTRTSGSFFSIQTRVFKQSHFLWYILYIEQWWFRFIMIRTIGNRSPFIRYNKQQSV